MRDICKGIVWIALIIGLFAGMMKAKAGTFDELQKELQGVHKLYPKEGVGQCLFDGKGVLTFKRELTRRQYPCIVGFKEKDGEMDFTVHYVLTFRNDGRPVALYAFDEKDKSQKTLWRFGASV